MAFLQPAPVIGTAAIKRLAQQVSRRVSSPLAHSTASPAATSASPFICRQCSSTARNTATAPKPCILSAVARARASQQLRKPALPSLARCLSNSSSKKTATPAPPGLGANYDGDSAGPAGQSARISGTSFPETSSKSVAYWLLGSAASVFGIVVFGGLTRLTESGYAPALVPTWRHRHVHPSTMLIPSLLLPPPASASPNGDP